MFLDFNVEMGFTDSFREEACVMYRFTWNSFGERIGAIVYLSRREIELAGVSKYIQTCIDGHIMISFLEDSIEIEDIYNRSRIEVRYSDFEIVSPFSILHLYPFVEIQTMLDMSKFKYKSKQKTEDLEINFEGFEDLIYGNEKTPSSDVSLLKKLSMKLNKSLKSKNRASDEV